jgi:hypothetical protein
MYATQFVEEKEQFAKFERADGLVQLSARYCSGDDCVSLGHKEVFYGRRDGLEYTYHSLDRLLLRYNNFKHSKGLFAFIKMPFKTECYWKYRLDGLTRSIIIPGKSITTFFSDRSDLKRESTAELSSDRTDLSLGSVWVSCLRITCEGENKATVYTKQNELSEDTNGKTRIHLSELEMHMNLRMLTFILNRMILDREIEDEVSDFSRRRISLSEPQYNRSIHDIWPQLDVRVSRLMHARS